MKKIFILLITSFLFVNCCSQRGSISIEKKVLKEPMKILYSSENHETAFIYLLYPINVVINNSSKNRVTLSNFHIGKDNPKGINLRDFKRYLFLKDKIIFFTKEKIIKSKEELSLNVYYGIRLPKLSDSINKRLTKAKPNQLLGKSFIYNIVKDHDILELENKLIEKRNLNLYFNFLDNDTSFYKSIKLD